MAQHKSTVTVFVCLLIFVYYRGVISDLETTQINNNNNTTPMMTTTTSSPTTSGSAVVCLNGGSYVSGNGSDVRCQCLSGWTGARCDADVDECNSTRLTLNVCARDAKCLNSPGGYNCSCDSGYAGDGRTCTFIDLCANAPCYSGTCLSKRNSYGCLCNSGWKGDNCSQDIDECSSNSSRCKDVNSQCRNTNGSYVCDCIGGYFPNSFNVCTEHRLWPFGSDNVALAKGRNSKMTVDVTGGFPFYDQMHYQIQISSNGYVTFGPQSRNLFPPVSYSGRFPGNISMLAPYWSSMETSLQNDSMVAVDVYNFWNATLNLTNSEVYKALVARTAQFGNISFEPWFAVVVTWHNVVPYPAKIYAGFENATFQVILATDGNRSVAFVNYADGGMQWNGRSDNRTILIGMTDGTGLRFNFTGDVYRPDMTVGAGTGKRGQFYFDLGQPIVNRHLPCLKWYQMPTNRGSPMMTSKPDTLVPCPCSLEQALNDPRYVNESATGLCVRHRLNNVDVGVNLCCYDSVYRALIVGLGGGYLRSNNGVALEGWQKCCVDADLCQLFYSKQMSDNCQKYLPPATAAIWGDPSISPFIGEDFVFSGYGEYTFLRLRNGRFLMQGRFELRPNATSINATSLTSVALQAGNQSALEVQLKDGALRILTNSQTFPLPWTGGNLGGAVVESPNNLTIQLHFEESDILLQLSVVMDSLRLTALLPKSVVGWNESSGLLFKKCNGTYPQVTSESDQYNYFRTCQVTKMESVFLYSSDGYDYDLINNQSFVPTFISLNSTFPPWCGTSKSCRREYMITMDQTRALAAKAFEERFVERKTKLANFPPVFSSTQSSMLYALIGQELNIALNVTDPEGTAVVRYHVDTVINQTEWQMDGNIFKWRPSTAVYNTSSVDPFLQFHATDEANSSSLYWPFIHLCPCPIERGRCSYDYPPKLDMKTARGRLVVGRCSCLPGWTGEFCGRSMDVCSPNPCFPGVNCSSNSTDTSNGYVCASCPPGLESDGNWCYDVNECLVPPGNACTTCVNLLGTYKCTCDRGYSLSPDQKTCVDVDECSQRGRCVYIGQYCHNQPGSYECRCNPDYFTNGSTCVYAPIKFGGNITFKTFITTVSLDSLSNTKSEGFRTIAQAVESLIQMVYSTISGFVGVKVTQLQKGSIVAMYDLLFQAGSEVNASDLNKDLEKFLLDKNCQKNAPDCVLFNLVGIDVNMSNVYDKDLCASPMDNMCNASTMNCSTEKGQALCSCKSGFRPIAEYIRACEDIDECSSGQDICNTSMNTSSCINTQGSYKCLCNAGFQMYNGSCKDICQPNPCANGGTCVAREREYLCECVGVWAGLDCTEENPEAVRLRKVSIGLGVGLGILCLILIILLIAVCVWHYRNGTSYTCAALTGPSNGSYKGRRSVNVHQWNADEMEFQTNGSHLDQDLQPRTAPSAGRENPSYTNSTLELNRNGSNATKTSSEYF